MGMKTQNFEDGYIEFKRGTKANLNVTVQVYRSSGWQQIKFSMPACNISNIADQLHSALCEWQIDINQQRKALRGEE